MKCPDCNEGELAAGPVTTEEDGTEYFELTCLKCKHKFLDMKMPYSAFDKHEPSTAS